VGGRVSGEGGRERGSVCERERAREHMKNLDCCKKGVYRVGCGCVGVSVMYLRAQPPLYHAEMQRRILIM
jgi:hypothetical protein